MEIPSEWQLKRDHKHGLAFRPLETALLDGKVDAIYSQGKVFQNLQEATGELKAIEDLSRYPDWTLQVANIPAVITCTDEMANEHPELAVAYLKGMIKVGRWANEHKHAAAAILDIGKDFLLSHGYVENDFDVGKWAAPEFREQAAEELVQEKWGKVTKDKLRRASARLG